MSYRIYHTEGFILASGEVKEHNRLLWILTPDLGLIVVMAQGVRKITSKLRPHLQDLAHVDLALVRGREFWRVIGAERSSLLAPATGQPLAIAAWARLSGLLRRLIRGEGEQQVLFNDLKAAVSTLVTLRSVEEVTDLELIVELRLLHYLGYLPDRSEFVPYLNFTNWGQRPAAVSLALQRQMQQEITASLAASHL
jgi:DNA repair protein RecO